VVKMKMWHLVWRSAFELCFYGEGEKKIQKTKGHIWDGKAYSWWEWEIDFKAYLLWWDEANSVLQIPPLSWQQNFQAEKKVLVHSGQRIKEEWNSRNKWHSLKPLIASYF
jgi:hypothetical protein